jgi:nucleotide-binding universal stress UspA family protein
MVQFSKILVPTDFSDGSKVGYQYANDFAAKFGGTIDLIHIIPTLKYLAESMSKLGLPFDIDKDVYPKLIDQSRGYIEDDLTNYIDEEAQGKAIVNIDMKAFDVIVDTASSGNYDLVVMGTHGASANQLIKGNVTEKVIRYSKVPVLCVPASVPSEKIRRIIVPIDFSENSWKALPIAASFAAAVKGELILLHIKELYGSEGDLPAHTANQDETKIIRKDLIDRFSAYVNGSVDFDFDLKLMPDDDFDLLITEIDGDRVEIKITTVVRKGVSAHFEINDYANENADMMVMTTHGRSGLKQIFLGSTTEKVARYSRIPVLTVRPDLG